MEAPWMFYAICLTLFLMSTPATSQCSKETCGADCNRVKCNDNNGICMPLESEDICTQEIGGWWIGHGRGKWCKYYRFCKCCIIPDCSQGCFNGNCSVIDFGCGNGDCTAVSTCTCWPGWDGPACDQAFCNPECVHGDCVAPDTCDCEEGWTGAICDTAICNQGCVNGDCTAPDTCECFFGWTGPACDQHDCDPKCVNGNCTGPNECTCSPGWAGSTCEEHGDPECNPECQNGNCTIIIGPPAQPVGVCVCDNGWEDEACGKPICSQGCVNGTCTAPDFCECFAGWEGPACDIPICDPSCINGVCIEPDVCECIEGWQGPICDTPICDPACVNGTCTAPNNCECWDQINGPAYGNLCQFSPCFEKSKCIAKSGTCYDRDDPILQDTTACPQVRNAGNWCNMDCGCCFK